MIWNALSVDVEDWFHILEIEQTPPIERWPSLQGRVEQNTAALMDLLSQCRVTGSFFILGWIAEKYPRLVERIKKQSHEIGSHGYAHTPAFRQTPKEFRDDVARSIAVIQGLSGLKPVGYRIPGFSLTPRDPWVFEALAEAGFRYDSSLVPGYRFHGGWVGSPHAPHKVRIKGGLEISEFPVSTLGIGRRRTPFLGGGYLRALPLAFSAHGLALLNARGIPGMLYIHPRDIDPGQPRIRMPLLRRVASYSGLNSCESKLRFLLSRFRFTTVTNTLEDFFARSPAQVWQPRGMAANGPAVLR